MTDMLSINLRDVEEWREYDFGGRTYRIDKPQTVSFRPGGSTHRVEDAEGVFHIVPVPGLGGCVLRFKGQLAA